MPMEAKRNARQLLIVRGRWLTAAEFCAETGRVKVDHARDWLRAHADAGILAQRHRQRPDDYTGGCLPVEYTLRPMSQWGGL